MDIDIINAAAKSARSPFLYRKRDGNIIYFTDDVEVLENIEFTYDFWKKIQRFYKQVSILRLVVSYFNTFSNKPPEGTSIEEWRVTLFENLKRVGVKSLREKKLEDFLRTDVEFETKSIRNDNEFLGTQLEKFRDGIEKLQDFEYLKELEVENKEIEFQIINKDDPYGTIYDIFNQINTDYTITFASVRYQDKGYYKLYKRGKDAKIQYQANSNEGSFIFYYNKNRHIVRFTVDEARVVLGYVDREGEERPVIEKICSVLGWKTFDYEKFTTTSISKIPLTISFNKIPFSDIILIDEPFRSLIYIQERDRTALDKRSFTIKTRLIFGSITFLSNTSDDSKIIAQIRSRNDDDKETIILIIKALIDSFEKKAELLIRIYAEIYPDQPDLALTKYGESRQVITGGGDIELTRFLKDPAKEKGKRGVRTTPFANTTKCPQDRFPFIFEETPFVKRKLDDFFETNKDATGIHKDNRYRTLYGYIWTCMYPDEEGNVKINTKGNKMIANIAREGVFDCLPCCYKAARADQVSGEPKKKAESTDDVYVIQENKHPERIKQKAYMIVYLKEILISLNQNPIYFLRIGGSLSEILDKLEIDESELPVTTSIFQLWPQIEMIANRTILVYSFGDEEPYGKAIERFVKYKNETEITSILILYEHNDIFYPEIFTYQTSPITVKFSSSLDFIQKFAETDKFPENNDFINLISSGELEIKEAQYDSTDGWFKVWKVHRRGSKRIRDGGAVETKTSDHFELDFVITSFPTSLKTKRRLVGNSIPDIKEIEPFPYIEVDYRDVERVFGSGIDVIEFDNIIAKSFMIGSFEYQVYHRPISGKIVPGVRLPLISNGPSRLIDIERNRRIAITTIELAKYKKATFETVDYKIVPGFYPIKNVSFFQDSTFGEGKELFISSEEVKNRLELSLLEIPVEQYKDRIIIDPNLLFPDAFSFKGEVFPISDLDYEMSVPLSELDLLYITDFERDAPYIFISSTGERVIIQNVGNPKAVYTVIENWKLKKINKGYDARIEISKVPDTLPLFESDLDDLGIVDSDWCFDRYNRIAAILKL